jgi:hypothetical protein
MSSRVIIDIIEDFEEFIAKLEKRKGELEELKDDLLVYGDKEFLESIQRGMRDFKDGKSRKCKDLGDVKSLFREL